MQSIQLPLQTIRVESTLILSQIQSKTDKNFKETLFLLLLHIELLPFSPYALISLEKVKK